MSAGEASGDAHGAAVLGALDLGGHAVEARGMGGVELAAAGCSLDVDLRRTTAMGGVEVLGRAARTAAAFARLVAIAHRQRPGAALLVDLPDFNMPLAAVLGRLGVPVLGYVAPQLWAWRPGRARALARTYGAVACVLPFEEPLLRAAGVRATYVGHPAVDHPPLDREEVRRELDVAPGSACVALLPGSRPAERAGLLGPMLAAAERLRRRQGVEVLLAAAPSLSPPEVPSWVRVVTHRPARSAGPAAMAAADVVLTASGTATVEACIAGVPQVVAYRLATSTYWIARAVVRVPFIAMPNILLGRRAVPELIQGAATADALERHAAELLAGGAAAQAQREAAAEVRALLGPPGAARRTAELLLELER